MGEKYLELKATEALYQKFNEASKALPELCHDADPLSMGNFGIVIRHDDNTLTKIFYKPRNPKWHDSVLSSFNNEVNTLRLLTASPLEELETPILLKEPELIDDKKYMAHYSMTRVSGGSHTWDLNENIPDRPLDKLYSNAGKALAQFHTATKNMPFERAPHFHSSQINPVRFFDKKTNEALIKVDQYLEQHKIPGVIHGDYHGGNIMTDERHIVTGLIDFSATGQSDNVLSDFLSVPARYLPHFIKAYEEQSGRTIAPDAVEATKLSNWLTYLHSIKDFPEAQENAMSEIYDCLENLQHISGFKPTI